MTADNPPQQPLVTEPVQTAFLAIALAGGEDQRQVARMASFKKPRFDGGQQLVRHTDADETGCGKSIAVLDQRGSFGGRDNFVAHCEMLCCRQARVHRHGNHRRCPRLGSTTGTMQPVRTAQ